MMCLLDMLHSLLQLYLLPLLSPPTKAFLLNYIFIGLSITCGAIKSVAPVNSDCAPVKRGQLEEWDGTKARRMKVV